VAAFKRLVSSLSRFISPEDAQVGVQGTDLKFISSQPVGGALLLKGLWNRIGIDGCLAEALKDSSKHLLAMPSALTRSKRI
jgi:hypothetical protein